MYSTITSFFHQHTSLGVIIPPGTVHVSKTPCIVPILSTPPYSPILHYITAKKHQLLSSASFPEKHVHFNQHVHVRLHIHQYSYTDEEFEATFYTEAEYAVIKHECREIVLEILHVQRRTARINNNKNSAPLDTIEEESPSCPRWGLERMLNRGTVKTRRLQAIDFVMEEQDRQWHVGTEEPDKICAVYSELSDLCQAEAHRTGLQDQQDQEQFLMMDDFDNISL